MTHSTNDTNSKNQSAKGKTCCNFSPLRFLRQLLRTPGAVGAVAPSGSKLCSTMAALAAAAIKKSSSPNDAYLVELGAGTGVVTKALLAAGIKPEHMLSMENNAVFAEMLRKQFPQLKVIDDSAENMQQHLAKENINQAAVIVSSLPLLSLPPTMRSKIIEQMIKTLPRGGDIIQFTYGLKAPYHDYSSDLEVLSKKCIAFNLPPAFVWHYKKR